MKILHINSTTKGGGVAEVLTGLSQYEEMDWVAPYEKVDIPRNLLSEFFFVTKRFHNTLQGERHFLTPNELGVYEKVNKLVWPFVENLAREYPLIVVHDPQPAALLPLIRKTFPGKHLVWRCHIDLSDPNPQTWQYMVRNVNSADLTVFHSEEFVPQGANPPAVIMPPSIDPKSLKNRDLDEIPDGMARRIVAQYAGKDFREFLENLKNNAVKTRILEETAERAGAQRLDMPVGDLVRRIHGIGLRSRLVVQISRYDVFKDPVGVVEVYARFVKRTRLPKSKVPLLIYAGEIVNDDPEGVEVLKEVVRTVAFVNTEIPGIKKQIKLLVLPNWDKEANAVEVNALQRSASVVMQKSLAEGFGLTVSEALWKLKPVIGGNVGGIRRQIIHDLNGYLVNSVYDAAEALDRLFSDPKLAASMGKIGKEIVRRKYLTPAHCENYSVIYEILGDSELKRWLMSKKMVDIQGLVSKVRRSRYLRRSGNNAAAS